MDNQQSQGFKPKTNYTDGTMASSDSQAPKSGEQSSSGGLGGIGNKLSAAAGGSKMGGGDSQSLLDKGINYLQQSITGSSGQTNNESAQKDTSHHKAIDEIHPEKISEFLRNQNRSLTKEGK